MEAFDVVGQVIAGKVAHILIREKTDAKIELGNLLVAEGRDGSSLILQVHNLSFGSQLDQDLLELTAGLELEGRGSSLEFFDADLRNYVLAEARAVASISGDRVTIPKALPDFFRATSRLSSTRYCGTFLAWFWLTPHARRHVRRCKSLLDLV